MGTTVHDYAPEVPRPDEKVEPSVAADETTSGGGSTATVKLLRLVRDSTNGFGPLRSIAERLCLVLGNCEVCSLL